MTDKQIDEALEALQKVGEKNVARLADLPAEIEEIFPLEFRIIRQALERQREGWKVVYDGPSLAMLLSPDGRIFRLQELGAQGKQWGNAEDNDEICAQLAAAPDPD